ncbi:MAG: glycosyltransferase family 4 protein [Candidatus Promineifilaceae bacterium]
MNDVLLTVSGVIDPEIEAKIARGERPKADYIAMSRAFEADIIDYAAAQQQAGPIARLLSKVFGRNILLAWVCFSLRRRYRVIFTDGEQVGIWLALFLKFFGRGDRARHLMIAHLISVPKKMIFFDRLGLQSHVDVFFVYSSWQKRFIEERWQVPPERVVWTPFMVDADFFSPAQAGKVDLKLGLKNRDAPPLCAVGLEFRDYATLMTAVKDLDIQVVIAAASPWSKRQDTTAEQEIPENVLVRRFSQFELRDLYAMCCFFVMPLYNVEFQAGVTAILEAMAMEKAVICSQTPGQTDVVVEGENGLYVPPEDPAALRKAICDLLADVETARQMGRNGRSLIEQKMSLERYVEGLLPYVRQE